MSDPCSACGAEFRTDDSFCAKCGAARAARQVDFKPMPLVAAGPGPKKSGGGLLAGMLLIALLGVVPVFFMSKGCSGSTEGSITVTGGPGRGFTFIPTGCESMQPTGHMGANLHGNARNDGAIYVTMDPIAGAAVNVEVPGSCRNANGTDCTVFTVPRQRCTRFEANVQFNGVSVNEVRKVDGSLALTCTLEDGTTVSGQATFEGC